MIRITANAVTISGTKSSRPWQLLLWYTSKTTQEGI
jgi:hypothetical protein